MTEVHQCQWCGRTTEPLEVASPIDELGGTSVLTITTPCDECFKPYERLIEALQDEGE